MGGEHLEGGEGEDSSETIVQETKTGQKVNEEEVERTEAHYGHDVRGIGKEGMAGDGEDRGNGVEGEDDVGELDGEESEEEDGDPGVAVFADEELVLTETDGVDAGDPGDPTGCLFVALGRGQNQADGGDEQDGSEGVTDPGEAREKTEAADDEGSAQEDGSSDSPEEDFRLTGWLDLEGAEEDEEDEEVVDGERLFDCIAGEVLGCILAAQGAKEEEAKCESGGDPEYGGSDSS